MVGLRYRASYQPLRDKIAVCAGGRQSRLGDYRAAGRAGALPITWSLGPVAAYNVLCLLAPAIAGWSAFVLCRWITHSYWPSIAGGWVFGFSSYIAAALLTHLDVALVFPVPLAVWLVLRRLHDDLAPGRFVAGLAILIAAQFLFFAEVAASATFAGAIAFALAVAFTDANTRRRLWDSYR